MLPSSPSKGPFLSFIFIVSNVFTGSFLTTSFLAAFYILTPECYKIAIRLITHQFSNCNHTVTCLFMHDSQANLNQEVEDALYLSVICWLGIFSGLQVCQKTNAQKKKKGNMFLNSPFRQCYSVEDCLDRAVCVLRVVISCTLMTQSVTVFLSVEFQVFISLGHHFHPCFVHQLFSLLICYLYRKIISVLFRKGILALFFSHLLFVFLCGRRSIQPAVRK